MKTLAIALKDIRHMLHSLMGWMFMFGLPLLMAGMFYLMFGSAIQSGGFDLPRTRVAVANLDRAAPRLQAGKGSLPEGIHANTLAELVLAVLQSDDLADLVEVWPVDSAEAARQAVDRQQAQVAIIIPEGFGRQFADPDGQAEVVFYQDPTLTLSPAIVRSIMSRFMDSIAGIKIAIDQATDAAESGADPRAAALAVQGYLSSSRTQTRDPVAEFLNERPPAGRVEQTNPVVAIVSPIMAGLMVFYAFYTGTSSAESILQEDEQRTLPRLFTTPTPRGQILTGKLLSVFLTVSVQVVTLIFVSRYLFGIEWGQPAAAAAAASGVVVAASSMGIFINSLIKDTRQGGMIFGGLLTVSGMLGMVRVFAVNSASAARLGDTVGLLVPQGWGVRGLLLAQGRHSLADLLPTLLVLWAWSGVFFVVGVWRFKKRYG